MVGWPGGYSLLLAMSILINEEAMSVTPHPLNRSNNSTLHQLPLLSAAGSTLHAMLAAKGKKQQICILCPAMQPVLFGLVYM